jgi:hypothetical protein
VPKHQPAGDDEVAAQDSEPNPDERRQLCRGQLIERRHPPDHSFESVGLNPPVFVPDHQQYGRDRERERHPAAKERNERLLSHVRKENRRGQSN